MHLLLLLGKVLLLPTTTSSVHFTTLGLARIHLSQLVSVMVFVQQTLLITRRGDTGRVMKTGPKGKVSNKEQRRSCAAPVDLISFPQKLLPLLLKHRTPGTIKLVLGHAEQNQIQFRNAQKRKRNPQNFHQEIDFMTQYLIGSNWKQVVGHSSSTPLSWFNDNQEALAIDLGHCETK